MARLQRDGHSRLLAEVYAGEKSAHAAALEMGYRKQQTPLERMQRLWGKLKADERLDFLRWVRNP